MKSFKTYLVSMLIFILTAVPYSVISELIVVKISFSYIFIDFIGIAIGFIFSFYYLKQN